MIYYGMIIFVVIFAFISILCCILNKSKNEKEDWKLKLYIYFKIINLNFIKKIKNNIKNKNIYSKLNYYFISIINRKYMFNN